MEEKIFLEKNRNVKSISKTNNIDISLEQKTRLMPFNDVSDTLNLYQLYSDERDACTKYRLIFTINALCSNVLYNMKSEVIWHEDSATCQLVHENFSTGYTAFTQFAMNTSQITHKNVIRNTEYSHPEIGNFSYKCGVDIFNNHLLRGRGFNPIWGVPSTTYNTIEAQLYDSNWNPIQEQAGTGTTLTNLHVYRIDNIMSMEEAFAFHVKESDGWFGFDNPSLLKLHNNVKNNNIIIDRLLNNRKGCEFIDLYPDRTLFSFIPYVNKERKRLEYNWDWCITYPYKSDVNKFNTVMGKGGVININDTINPDGTIDSGGDSDPRPQLIDNYGGIRSSIRLAKGGNGQDIYVFKTAIKHNLKYGDVVKFYVPLAGIEITESIQVQGVGDENNLDADHCFRIYKNTFRKEELFAWLCNEIHFCYMKRLAGANECGYYFRKFKKYTKEDGKLPDSSINKLAYGESIYGDRTAQLLYTDDIDTRGLRDNLGRPLTELYLTVIKTNRGHEEWYKNNNYTSSTIERSHAFGKVTSGVDMGNELENYNIRKLHNVKPQEIHDARYETGFNDVFGEAILPPSVLEDDIKLSSFSEFYGDIVEFDPTTNSETVLEKVYHRVNTAQRETLNPYYYDIHYDNLVSDDYESFVVFGEEEGIGKTTENVIDSDETGLQYSRIVFESKGNDSTLSKRMTIYATTWELSNGDDGGDDNGGGDSGGGTGGGGLNPEDPTLPENPHNPFPDMPIPDNPNLLTRIIPIDGNIDDGPIRPPIEPDLPEAIYWDWEILEIPDWASITSTRTLDGREINLPVGYISTGRTTVYVNVAANRNIASRTGNIRIKIGNTTYTTVIAQKGAMSSHSNGFTVESEILNYSEEGHPFPGNIQLEGYYYSPHTRIPIRQVSSAITNSVGFVLSYNSIRIEEQPLYVVVPAGQTQQYTYRLIIEGASDHKYVIDDLFGITKTDGTLLWYNLYSKGNNVLTLEPADDNKKLLPGEENSIDQIILCEDGAPQYASYNKKEESFVWREVLPYSQTSENSEIGDVTFTNGAIYRQQNVTFELRRQDPFGEYGLQIPKKYKNVGGKTATRDANPLRSFKKKGMRVDLSQLLYLPIEAENSCI